MHSAQISQKQNEHNIYVIMTTIYPPGCHQSIINHPGYQWLCGSSCTWAHDVRLHITGTNGPKTAQQAKQGVS